MVRIYHQFIGLPILGLASLFKKGPAKYYLDVDYIDSDFCPSHNIAIYAHYDGLHIEKFPIRH